MDVTGNYQIVGFDGLPVQGGVGRKAALVHDPMNDRYAVIAAGQPLRWVDANRIAEAAERGLVTRFLRPLRAWSPGMCLSYAHGQFLATRDGGMLLAQIEAQSTFISESWVWCEPLPDMLKRLESWGELFLGYAARRIDTWEARSAEERFSHTVADVDRARFCITAAGDGALPLRRRAAVLLAAAYLLHGRANDAALWRDLALDFNPGELDGLRAGPIQCAPTGADVSPAAAWTDDPVLIRRESACI